VRRFGYGTGTFRLGWLALAWRVPLRVLSDFALLVPALVRRPDGAFRRVGAEEGPAGWGAFLTVAASIAPNTYVVETEENGDVVVHDLQPERASPGLL
jgi:hypothetical protein